MPTLLINSQVVLILRLICHAERVYEEIMLCNKYKTQLHFPPQSNRLVQNLPKATINPSTKEKLNLWDFSLPLDFSFTLHSSSKPTDASASRNSTQNAAIQENLKTNEAYEGSH